MDLSKVYKMSNGTLITINMENYSEDEFLVAEIDFLGCNPNSHKIAISEEVFRKYASTVLGKFLVAKVAFGDATGHASDETIVGYIPSEQEVRFVRNSQGYLRGIIDGVVSKQYASDFCKIFTQANSTRSVSVEMGVEEKDDKDGTIAKRFNIMGVTVLGMSVRPSSPGSTINIRRFSEEDIKKDCEDYYKSVWQRLSEKEDSELDAYVKNRKTKFAKSYSVNTIELKETPWGDVDKTELRDRVMEASNRSEIVDKVYLQVLDGWEDAPSENLKYPVMEFKDGTFYYNRFALASALAYARQHDEADVVSKIEELYKKFKLAEEGEEKNMSMKFESKDSDVMEKIAALVKEHEGEKAEVVAVDDDYIIFTIGDARYYVSADLERDADGEIVANIYWDTKKEDDSDKAVDDDAHEDDLSEDSADSKDENAEDGAEETKDEEDDVEAKECSEEESLEEEEAMEEESLEEEESMEKEDSKEASEDESEESKEECSDEEALAEEEALADAKDSEEEPEDKDAKISELEDIIMQKDEELAELRKFKEDKENAERDFAVQHLLEEIREYVDTETLESLKAEGLSCKLSEINGWENKVKALAFDRNSKESLSTGIWSMAIPKSVKQESTSKWDSI